VLPQKQEGRTCGWYNARVENLLNKRKDRPKLKILSG
jgi:hypothetical protein